MKRLFVCLTLLEKKQQSIDRADSSLLRQPGVAYLSLAPFSSFETNAESFSKL